MKMSLMALVATFCLVVGLPLAAMAGPTPGSGIDLDGGGVGDGVEDAFDNCTNDTRAGHTFEANGSQIDFDHDGCGNNCDADYDNNGAVAGGDFVLFSRTFGTSAALNTPGTAAGQYNGAVDSNGDNAITGADFVFFSAHFGDTGPTVGPSGFPASQKVTTTGVGFCP